MPWAYTFGAYVGTLTFQIDDFCTADPPDVPDIGATDVLAVISIADPIAHAAAISKFTPLVAAFLWYDLCECISGAQPSPPESVDNPADIAINPPSVPTTAAGASCHDELHVGELENGGPFTYAHWAWHGNPSSLTSYRIVIHQGRGTNGQIAPATWRIIQTGNSSIGLYYDVTPPAAYDHVLDIPVVSPATEITVQGTSSYEATPGDKTTVEIIGYCDGSPSAAGGQQPCCPPDPTLQAVVNAILETVRLIQRQSVPFAYVPGAAHESLTGSGELDIQGVLGIKVTPAAVPSWAGVTGGDPDELWLESWVTWGNADGWAERIWLRHAPQVSFPPMAGQYTKLGYTLAPGLEVDIVELVREA
jgi:hypothetical protein